MEISKEILSVNTGIQLFVQKSSNAQIFFKLKLWSDNELMMSEMKKKMGIPGGKIP